MKHRIISFLLCFALIASNAIAAAGDIRISYKNASDTAWVDSIFAKQNNAILITNGSGVPSILGPGTTGYVLTSQGAGSPPIWSASGGGGGSGTVTSVSVTTANGVSATVANSTTTPALTFTLGAITPTTVNGLTLTGSGTISVASGKTLTGNNTLTFTGTDGSTLNVGGGGTLGSAAYTSTSAYEVPLTFSTGLTRSTNTITVNATNLAASGSGGVTGTLPEANGGTGITSLGTGVATALGVNVGTAGAFVVNGGALGTPASGNLSNATSLPISTGVSGLGSGVATFLGTPSSANLASAVTDETGSGAVVFATSPSITTPTITGNISHSYSGNSTLSGTIGLGGWYTSYVPFVQPAVSNKPGIFDVLANGTGQDSWLDIGTDFTTGTGSQEFLSLRYYSQSFVSLTSKALAAGTVRVMQLQGNGSGVIIGPDTVSPAGDAWLRVTGGKAYLGFDSGVLLTDSTGGHGLRISPAGRTNSTERSVAEFRTFNATAANGSAFTGVRAYGTRDSPTAVQSGAEMNRFDAYGYGATGYSSAPRAAFVLRTTENWTDSAQGTDAIIQVTATGGTTTSTVATFNSTATTLAGGLNVGGGTTITKIVSAVATLDFGSTGAGAVSDLTVTATGATTTSTVSLGVPNGSVTTTADYFAWVSAADTVTVRFSPKATEDPASGSFRVTVFNF